MSKRILIIDDEENIRRVMRLTLEAAGYEVGEASDGERGLAAYKDGATWDAVLLDQKMPGMDGLDVLRAIRGRNEGARVIMMTAFASIELAVDAMKLGASDFVRKPTTPEIMRNVLQAALAKPAVAATDAGHAPAATEAQPLASTRPLIQHITMNGFSFVPATDVAAANSHAPNERRFIVTNPQGAEYEVVVEIDDEAIGYVERMTRRPLPPASSFWTMQAERMLGNHLWHEGGITPGARLTLKSINRDDLTTAAHWAASV